MADGSSNSLAFSMLPVQLRAAATLLIASVLLGGCVPMMAANVIGMAASGAQGRPVSNAHLQPAAETACTTRAAAFGRVHIIDVQQKRVDKIIVWGTVQVGPKKQSFECHYGTRITAFKLREIKPAM